MYQKIEIINQEIFVSKEKLVLTFGCECGVAENCAGYGLVCSLDGMQKSSEITTNI
jgi:hypothetical protein